MAGWILTIEKRFPDHWDFAKGHGFWDTVHPSRIEAGDDLFFWLTGGAGLVAWCTATAAPYGITDMDNKPWHDTGTRKYKFRIPFRLVTEAVVDSVRWSVIQQEIDSGALARNGVVAIRADDGIARVSQHFERPQIDLLWPDQPVVELDLPAGLDTRDWQRRAIAQRRGQREFRRQLLRAYDGQCAVTGCTVDAVLEAAHISPYRGGHTNDVRNGLLLRADIHTLFDLHLLTITPEHSLRTAPSLSGTLYGDLPTDAFTPPRLEMDAPAAEVLTRHNFDCTWLTTASKQPSRPA